MSKQSFLRNWRSPGLPVRLAVVGVAVVVGLGGCSDGDDGDTGAQGPSGADGSNGFAFQPATIFVASNGGGDTSVRVRTEALGLLNTYSTGANEGVLVDRAGQLVQAGDSVSPGSIVTACNAVTRMSGDATRSITGATTTLGTPKGIVELGDTGLILAATNAGNNLLVFGAAAAGDVAPVATVGLAGGAWDATYDARSDRLFVAMTNGSVSVFDGFVADNFGASGVARTFTSATAGGATNFHGIDYDAATDRLVVSDVGSAADASDGSLYAFRAASTLSGSVTPDVTISGPSTLLGNPVDVQFDGAEVRVAEKSNSAILVYTNLFESAGGDLPADLVASTTSPESLAVVPDTDPKAGATDVIEPSTAYRLLFVSNPGAGTEGRIFSVSRNLGSAPTLAFTTTLPADNSVSAENLSLDRTGAAFVAFDGASDGFTVVGGIGSRSGGATDTSRDRTVLPATTPLASPKGLEIADDLGLVIVSDFGAGQVVVFSACAAGDAAPVATISPAASPWDSDYDPRNDTLYVALTNGTVAAYDNFSANLGASTPRTITPVSGGAAINSVTGAAGTNLHGVRYDQRSDTLILADVGAGSGGAFNTDGALMSVENASTASGNTEVGVLVFGAGTNLGNPVDIAFDGADLYVAEKANAGGAIHVWRNFLTAGYGAGSAPSASQAATNPESIVIQQLD